MTQSGRLCVTSQARGTDVLLLGKHPNESDRNYHGVIDGNVGIPELQHSEKSLSPTES